MTASTTTTHAPSQTPAASPASENVAVVERAAQRWNAGDLDGYLEMYDQAAVLHGYPGVEPGFESIRTFYRAFFASFPASRLTFDEVIAHDDRIVVRFTLNGTHGGDFQGIPPTGRAITIPGITILRFAGGRCVERWSQADFLGLLGQLGAFPPPAQPAG